MDIEGQIANTSLILYADYSLSLVLKKNLQPWAGSVEMVPSVHQAAIQVVFREPDRILIEVSTKNLSGLKLLEILKELRGLRKPPRILFYADPKEGALLQRFFTDLILVEESGPSAMNERMKNLLETQNREPVGSVVQWKPYQERIAAWKPERKERDILEKLGQLGILKKS